MTKMNPPDRTAKKSFWRRHALGASIITASLSPLVTSSGCSESTPQGCPAGYTDCGGYCVATGEDPGNCGACGAMCDVSAPYCSAGVCSATCATGLAQCGNGCADLQTSPSNCGACGTACSNGTVCEASACVCPAGVNCDGGPGVGGGGNPGVGGGANPGIGGGANPGIGGGANPGVGGGGDPGAGGGGDPGAGGSNPDGSGGSSSGDNPDGYWTYGSMHGCVWTGVDTVEGASTTIVPQDFVSESAGGPYCVSGTVDEDEDYETVALLGFNVGEPAADADCTYKPAVEGEVGPPAIEMTGTGLAISFTKSVANTLRVQIQGPNGADDPGDRWCYTITDASGPIFAPYEEFNTECWDEDPDGFYSGQPISAVVFLTPGNTSPTDFEYCIDGFADGNSVDDAPEGGESGPLSGTIGGSGSTDLDYERVKVKKDGKSYIIQNNNWGDPGGTDQTIEYTDNSFKITSATGSGPGGGVPASFPSIFIGANGDIAGGAYSTSSDDNLPMVVNSIGAIPTSMSWGGGSGDFNATYDVWFSASSPEPGSYDDGISGFVMVWFYKPGNNQPIGSVQRQATIAGQSWDVWVGPRGGDGSNSGAPVVSYVAPSGINSLSFDLKDFITDASQNGIDGGWYLTDVFAGFEIWSGGGTEGLSIEEFSIEVQ